MTERVGWAELPVELRRLIEYETGTVTGSEAVSEGLNCSLALILDADSGPLFLKGARSSASEEVSGLRREAQISPTVSALGAAPAVRHRFEGEGWHCLAFDYVAGTHADLTPGSADVAAVASVLRAEHAENADAVAGARLCGYRRLYGRRLFPVRVPRCSPRCAWLGRCEDRTARCGRETV